MVRLPLNSNESVKITAFPQTITISNSNTQLVANYTITTSRGVIEVFDLRPGQTKEYRVEKGPCTILNITPVHNNLHVVIIVEYSL
ncbi:hypothetical protein [Clostridium felsineum]|uniref:hypothetical protein n=1 Tax=Clostridium felsineum TaxID=36839 RepID=UPI00098C6091|nr:hypothetical protein [Clostridium felsineum]URZ18559.1 hypothetical protein CLFE_046470 [Clostridium felsineum DSM 794]